MPFDINEFKTRVGGSLASPAYFRVLFTGAIVDPDGVNLLSLLCNQAQMPGRLLATNEYTTHGPIRKVPYSSIYDDLVFGFYCTEGSLDTVCTANEEFGKANLLGPSPHHKAHI